MLAGPTVSTNRVLVAIVFRTLTQIDCVFTPVAVISHGTVTEILIDAVDADASVETRGTGTIVHIQGAVASRVADGARTPIRVGLRDRHDSKERIRVAACVAAAH
jgi:hypothetical protein